MKVYMIADYDEYGSEHCRVTLDPGKLEGFVREYYGSPKWFEGFADKYMAKRIEYVDSLREEALEGLKDGLLLEECEAHNITGGWGGLQLFILELE